MPIQVKHPKKKFFLFMVCVLYHATPIIVKEVGAGEEPIWRPPPLCCQGFFLSFVKTHFGSSPSPRASTAQGSGVSSPILFAAMGMTAGTARPRGGRALGRSILELTNIRVPPSLIFLSTTYVINRKEGANENLPVLAGRHVCDGSISFLFYLRAKPPSTFWDKTKVIVINWDVRDIVRFIYIRPE